MTVDFVGDIVRVFPYVMRDGGELGVRNWVSAALIKNRGGYGAYVVEEELVITCHVGRLLFGVVGCLLLRGSARSFLG